MHEQKQPQVADLWLLHRQRERDGRRMKRRRRRVLYDPEELRELRERGNEKHKGEMESKRSRETKTEKEAKSVKVRRKAP